MTIITTEKAVEISKSDLQNKYVEFIKQINDFIDKSSSYTSTYRMLARVEAMLKQQVQRKKKRQE